MEPAEVEFLAEKELVTIVPNFSLDRIHLIGVGGAGLGRDRGWGRGDTAWGAREQVWGVYGAGQSLGGF